MNLSLDVISKSLTSFGNPHIFRVVYMGPRHNSNMKAFKTYCLNENSPRVEESHVYGLKQLNKFPFKHMNQPQKFFPIRPIEYRLFMGMNPTFQKDDLKFDSDFQCGNLDLAIYINPTQYDLIMRVDSNTKGHTSWFYFKVSNATPNQKIKFNIINFNKKYLLYKDGMKPYVFKKSTKQWTQTGISVTYYGRKLRYKQCQQMEYRCLSFIYEFKDTEEVYFAYCIPYSYSFLLHRLQQFRSKAPHLMKIDYQNQSSGGLPIPILTITNFKNDQEEKANILCVARLHPGQTQGSWMMDGFINHLLLPQSSQLRDKIIFRIVPMVNVDGVVLGNFRTGILGRDLNRCFRSVEGYNEIKMLRKIAAQIKPQTFLDFHGHSSKKNVFIYGPDYKIQDRGYILSRIFPKLISKQTEAFRYYSCSFNITKGKMATGRAIMLKEFKVQFSYTIEASTYGYGPSKSQTNFNRVQYIKVGEKIANSLNDFIKIIKITPKLDENKLKNKEKLQETNDPKTLEQFFLFQKNIIHQILKDQSIVDKQEKQQDQSQSDCEDQSNDYSNVEINKIMQAKFQPKVRKKQKNSNKSKNGNDNSKIKKEKKDTSIEAYKKTVELIPSKLNASRNRSFMRKSNNEEFSNSIIQISNYHSNFDTRTTKIIENHSGIINMILKKRERNRLFSDSKDLHFRSIFEKRNNVHYDWSEGKNQTQKPTKHLPFELPESAENMMVSMQKQGFRITQKQHKTDKKKTPLLSVKKSLLPNVRRSADLQKQELQSQRQKNMLCEILQEHKRKRKDRRDLKILFL